jgi:hypothetical protein
MPPKSRGSGGRAPGDSTRSVKDGPGRIAANLPTIICTDFLISNINDQPGRPAGRPVADDVVEDRAPSRRLGPARRAPGSGPAGAYSPRTKPSSSRSASIRRSPAGRPSGAVTGGSWAASYTSAKPASIRVRGRGARAPSTVPGPGPRSLVNFAHQLRFGVAVRIVVLEHQIGDRDQLAGHRRDRHRAALPSGQPTEERPDRPGVAAGVLGRLGQQPADRPAPRPGDRAVVTVPARLLRRRHQPQVRGGVVAVFSRLPLDSWVRRPDGAASRPDRGKDGNRAIAGQTDRSVRPTFGRLASPRLAGRGTAECPMHLGSNSTEASVPVANPSRMGPPLAASPGRGGRPGRSAVRSGLSRRWHRTE